MSECISISVYKLIQQFVCVIFKTVSMMSHKALKLRTTYSGCKMASGQSIRRCRANSSFVLLLILQTVLLDMFPYICAKMVKASFLLYVWAKVLSGVECASLKVQNTICFGKMLCMYMFKYRVQIHRELSFYLVLHELGRFGKRPQGLSLKIQLANHWSELAKSYICCSERNIITLPRSPTP